MAVYYAEIEYMTTLTVRFELPDGVEPTDEDVMDAASYVDNHHGKDGWFDDPSGIHERYGSPCYQDGRH